MSLRGGLSVTPTTSSPFPFPPTTDKSSLVLVTDQSNYGIRSGTANLPSPRKGTPNGCHVFVSAQILRLQSLLALDGISWSRYVASCVGKISSLGQMMLLQPNVFATSELSSYEINQSPMH